MIIVADTSPINYLVLIGEINILEPLFGRVLIPQAVFNEMQREKTPASVRAWTAAAPPWLEVRQADPAWFKPKRTIGDGEREAIALAKELNAFAVLMDDRDGTKEARENNLQVLGTINILDRAAEINLLDLSEAIDRLRKTSFRFPPAEVMEALLKRDEERKKQDQQKSEEEN
jgi:predicted nucleic acid-binding protein